MNRKHYTALALVLGVTASTPSGAMNFLRRAVRLGAEHAGQEVQVAKATEKLAAEKLAAEELAAHTKKIEEVSRDLKHAEQIASNNPTSMRAIVDKLKLEKENLLKAPIIQAKRAERAAKKAENLGFKGDMSGITAMEKMNTPTKLQRLKEGGRWIRSKTGQGLRSVADNAAPLLIGGVVGGTLGYNLGTSLAPSSTEYETEYEQE